MTPDIPTRLRLWADTYVVSKDEPSLLREAADAIEQLTRERDEALALLREVAGLVDEMPEDLLIRIESLERAR